MADLTEYLRQAVADRVSDVFIVAGGPLTRKKDGELIPLEEDKLMPAQTKQMVNQLYTLAKRSMENYVLHLSDCFSFSVPGLARFRVSTYQQRRSMAAAIHILPFELPEWGKAGIPEPVMELADLNRGLVLLSGPAGSGKTATAACLVDRINRTRACQVITVEDPIGFLHKNQKSVISQQEVGSDTEGWEQGMDVALRQASDVIFLGSLTDWPMLQRCMDAAETGRLVLAALPVKGAVNALQYVFELVEDSPQIRREQARSNLSRMLSASISQQLLPAAGGGAIPAFEQVRLDRGIRRMLREGQLGQLQQLLTSGNRGLVSMDQAILSLYREGSVTLETALDFADNPEQLKRRCG